MDGEVEKVLWNHFDPFTFLVSYSIAGYFADTDKWLFPSKMGGGAKCICRYLHVNTFLPFQIQVSTDQGTVQLFDARQDNKYVWTLNAHSEGVNGMVLSTQCPDCLVTASSDKTIKIWDIANGQPTCIQERNLNLGTLHCLDGCPDAPFVMVLGGDNTSNNMKVFDIRESATVRSRFGGRELKNPLRFSDFGYSTVNDAEAARNIEQQKINTAQSDLVNSGKVKDAEMFDKSETFPKPASGGAAKKFLNKKKKKKKKQF